MIAPTPEPAEEIAKLRDRWMRAEAEIANVLTRARRDVDEARLYAIQKFATDMVEGVETLQRGLDTLPAPKPGEPALLTTLRDGFSAVERNFCAMLKRNGVEREVSAGRLFDANLHQAMAEEENEYLPPGAVIRTLSSGWLLHGRLLRPAMVVVAKAPAPARTNTTR
ncbi:nucleotide exchange factor GrpE [Acidisoma cladoniae]|uniref:nucleotide exchange factor GrpE n=1 Tax=Acidisoma cladoniae TaxID=3040935 RepID=UPI00254ED4A8|nr:nucleotide exchange factor GrpE [Acidisoma sp. PAMC 29798]